MGLEVDAVGTSQPVGLPPTHTVHHWGQGIAIPGDDRARVWYEGKLGGAWESYLTSVRLKAFQVPHGSRLRERKGS